ncbi:transketolase family protein [Candidatus Aerophobetes bacterium]|nr:transketolase family protein [Candidatus Aerophobetes bacterium]
MSLNKLIATRDAFGEELVEIGKKNKNLVVLSADLAKSTRTIEFATVFPERFFNAGVAEQNMMGIAAGLSTSGFVPIVSTLAIFAAGRAYDQVRNTIAHSRLNVKIVATHSGVSMGKDGSSHQSIEDIALMRVIPHMVVISPADGPETKKALRSAIEYEGPVYMRLGRPELPVVTQHINSFNIGKADVLQEGTDVSIITCGIMVHQALKAAEILSSQNIRAGVINMHTIKPLDVEVIHQAARSTLVILTAEDHSIIGGLGSAVLETLSCANIRPPVYRIGVRDVFGESGSTDQLMKKYELTWENIVQAVHKILNRNN